MTPAPHHSPVLTDRRGGWCQTFLGVKFHHLDPRPEDIRIEDIAHALSHVARFGGHTKPTVGYSVAQHCVLAARHVSPAAQLAALLHDASEAYTGDVPRPLKRHMAFLLDGEVIPFKVVEDRIQACVHERFNVVVTPEIEAEVKAIDESLLVTEARDLMSPLHPDWSLEWLKGRTPLESKVTPWSSLFAKSEFLREFRRLTTKS